MTNQETDKSYTTITRKGITYNDRDERMDVGVLIVSYNDGTISIGSSLYHVTDFDKTVRDYQTDLVHKEAKWSVVYPTPELPNY